eukprot:gene55511-52828_t
MGRATELGVRHVAYWAGPYVDGNSTEWWAEIRKWKRG